MDSRDWSVLFTSNASEKFVFLCTPEMRSCQQIRHGYICPADNVAKNFVEGRKLDVISSTGDEEDG